MNQFVDYLYEHPAIATILFVLAVLLLAMFIDLFTKASVQDINDMDEMKSDDDWGQRWPARARPKTTSTMADAAGMAPPGYFKNPPHTKADEQFLPGGVVYGGRGGGKSFQRGLFDIDALHVRLDIDALHVRLDHDVPSYPLMVAITQAFYRTNGRSATTTLLARYNATSVNEMHPSDRVRLLADMKNEYKFDWEIIKRTYLERVAREHHGADAFQYAASAQKYGRRQRDAEDSKPADLDPPVRVDRVTAIGDVNPGVIEAHQYRTSNLHEATWPWGPGGVAASEVPGRTEATPDSCQTNVASDPPAPAPDYCPAPDSSASPGASPDGSW